MGGKYPLVMMCCKTFTYNYGGFSSTIIIQCAICNMIFFVRKFQCSFCKGLIQYTKIQPYPIVFDSCTHASMSGKFATI